MKKNVRKDLEKELADLTASLKNIDVAQEKETYNQTMKAIKDIKKLLSEDDAERLTEKQTRQRMNLELDKDARDEERYLDEKMVKLKSHDLELDKFKYQKAQDEKEALIKAEEAKANKKQRIIDNILRVGAIVVPIGASLLHAAMALTVQYRDAERIKPEYTDALKYVSKIH